MPERTIHAVTGLYAGLKILPALALQSLGVWTVGMVASIEAITWALFATQGAALFSQALTHGYKSENVRKAGQQVLHMWLALIVILAFQHGKLIEIEIYSKAAGFLMAFEALVILKNLSDSGVKTDALDRLFSLFLAKQNPPPGPRTDAQSVADWEKLKAKVAETPPQ